MIDLGNETYLQPYSDYQDSRIEWIGQVPKHWAVLPQRSIFREVVDRFHPDEPMLSVTIQRGVIEQRELLRDSSKKDSSNQDRSSYKLVEPGDIVYNKMRAWQGAIGMSTCRGIVSPAYIVMRPRQEQEPWYFHYLFRIPAFAKEAERWSYGITSDQWSLRPEDFKNIYSPVPPIEEQRAIARFLDRQDRRINRFIRAKRRLIELLNEQKQAIIHQAVTRGLEPNVPLKPSGVDWLGDIPAHWKIEPIRRLAFVQFSNVDKHSVEGELPVLLCNYVDVYRNEYITSELPFMEATATAEEIRRYQVKQGDVIITKDSESWDDIAVPALVVQELPGVICGYHLAQIRPNPSKLVSEYLFRSVQVKPIATQFHVAASGVTRFGLSKRAVLSALVPVPPPVEQEQIAVWISANVEHLQKALLRTRREIDLMREYRTRLIADVVTGKLDVRNHPDAAEMVADDWPEDGSFEPLDDELLDELRDLDFEVPADEEEEVSYAHD